MEFGSIEQEIFIEASPDVVYDVVSSPEHLAGWYVDEAELEAVPGASGQLVFGLPEGRVEIPIAVVEAVPGVRFSFRWVAPPAPVLLPPDAVPAPDNSLLVTFDLAVQGEGTLLRVTEAGLREQGWEAAVLEQYYNDHSAGWSALLARLVSYVGQLSTR